MTSEEAVHPRTRAGWRRWLERHHRRPEGVWLVSFKKATGRPRVDYDDAVEEALCFGWVDSRARTLDDERTMLFDAFPAGVRRGILQWIASAKKPETRARRVEDTARLAARNIRANQWRPPS